MDWGRESDLTEQDKTRRFEQTALPHLDAAYNLARWLAGNDHDAADVVQEAYLRALKYFETFRGGSAKAWLLAIVRNAFYDWSARYRSDAVPFDETTMDGNETALDSSAVLTEDPLTLLVRRRDREMVNRAIAALAVDAREILVLRELEEMSYQEIAETLSIPMGTVMSRLARARDALRKRLVRESGREKAGVKT